MNAYAFHPRVTARVATPFFEDYITTCDDPDAFTVIGGTGRVTTVEAPPDALIKLWADALRWGHQEAAPNSTVAHLMASAQRTHSLLLSDIGDLHHAARVTATKSVAAHLGM